MSKRIVFKNISVDQMYGRSFGSLELKALTEHINVVHGVNASGKSTLAQALQCVMLLQNAKAIKPNVDATLETGDGQLDVEVRKSRRFCRLNGEDIQWNPELIRPKSYHISLHALLGAEAGDSSFAEEIMKEASGGFDVRKAAMELAFEQLTSNLTAGHNSAKRVKNASNRLKEVDRRQKKLASDRKRLDRLHEEQHTAASAANHVSLFTKALAFHEARRTHKDARQSVEALPKVLQKVDVDQLPDKLQKIRDDITRLEAEIAQRERAATEAMRHISASSLPESGLPEGFTEKVSKEIQRLADVDGRIETITESLAEFRRKAEKAWQGLSGGADSQQNAPQFNRKSVERLGSVIRRAFDAAAEKAALRAKEKAFQVEGGEALEQTEKTLRRALESLVDWLRAPTHTLGRGRMVRVVLGIAATLSLVSAWLAGVDTVRGWPGIAAALLIALAYYRLSMGERTYMRQKAEVESKIERPSLDLELPATWTNDTVGKLLDDVLARLASINVDKKKLDRLTFLTEDRESKEPEWQRVQEEVRRIEEATGLQGLSEETLFYVIERILDFQRAKDEVSGLEARLAKAQGMQTRHLAYINASLAPYGLAEVDSPAEAAAALEDLRTASQKLQGHLKDLAGIEREKEALTSQRARLIAKRQQLFAELDLDDQDRESLNVLVRQNKKLRIRREKLGEAKTLLDDKERVLRRSPGYSEDLKRANTAELEAELETFTTLAAKKDEIQREITVITTQVKSLEEGSALEKAKAELDEARARLRMDRDAKVANAVGGVLIEQLLTYIHGQGMPRVFRKAKNNFLLVTNGRYELRLKGNVFHAYDTEQRRTQNIQELSSATRVQLLLCVRIAFVESQETEYRFPLTLDEALANSDDQRASTVIETIARLAMQRQVIYFTAQEDEVQKWKNHAGDVPVKLIRLNASTPGSGIFAGAQT